MKFTAVEPLDLKFDVSQIIPCIQDLVEKCPSYEITNQISLTYSKSENPETDAVSLLQQGVGSLFDSKTNAWIGHEHQFRKINPLIKETYLEYILNEVAAISPVGIGRVRVMRLMPKSCYSWHKDVDPYRYHIPVITNPNCFYLTDLGGMEQIMDLGRVHRVNTAVMHTALNCSLSARIHLVFSCWMPKQSSITP